MSKKYLVFIIFILLFSVWLVLLFVYLQLRPQEEEVVIPGRGGLGVVIPEKDRVIFPEDTTFVAPVDSTININDGSDGSIIIPTPPFIEKVANNTIGGTLKKEGERTTIVIIEKGNGSIHTLDAETKELINTKENKVSGLFNIQFLYNKEYIIAQHIAPDTLAHQYIFTPLDNIPLYKTIPFNNLMGGDFGAVYVNKGEVILFDILQGTRTLLFKSPIKNIIPFKGEGESVALATPPSSYTESSFYILENGLLKEIVGGKGLISNPNNNFSKILYSSHEDGNIPSLYLFDADTEEKIQLPFNTFADRCKVGEVIIVCGVPLTFNVSTRSGEALVFPDVWLQGDVVFNDRIIVFDTNTNKVLYDFRVEEDVEISDIEISEDEKYILFININDDSLWRGVLY